MPGYTRKKIEPLPLNEKIKALQMLQQGKSERIITKNVKVSSMGINTCMTSSQSLPPSLSPPVTFLLPLSPFPPFLPTVKLEVLGPTSITVNGTTTTQVELSCEMSQYIHPDRDLWWFRGGQKLDNTQSKYSIGYRNGTKLALNGGSDVISSRVSVLTISQLTSSDSGVFTCKVFGTDQSGDVCLTVVDGKWSCV